MKFVLEIELGNEAMRNRVHLSEALKKVAGQISDLPSGQFRGDERKILDTNGNTVGNWILAL